MSATFLTAEWRHLAMLNFAIDPEILRSLVPVGTELDAWNGTTYVSVVGFLFLNTRVLGVPIPFHRDFEEVNLRFYVRHRGPEGWRRGVVFVKELVPRRAIAFVARALYGENYVAVPMSHQLLRDEVDPGRVRGVSYGWKHGGEPHLIELVSEAALVPLEPGGEDEFIAEHYWGYSAQRDGGTVEYRVEHPPWRAARATSSRFECDVAALYGERFAGALAGEPTSAFLADGSSVAVRRGQRLRASG